MNEKQDESLEEQLAAAEARIEELEDYVAEAEDALSEARAALADAESERDAIEERIAAPKRALETATQAAYLAGRDGPMRPVGDRVVRQSCRRDEIPTWFSDTAYQRFASAMYDGRPFVTNGYVMLASDSIDGLLLVSQRDMQDHFGPIGAERRRDDSTVEDGGIMARTFGSVAADLRFTSLVEDLFPTCAWFSQGAELDPLFALVNGVVVAVVMPMRRSKVAA